MDSQEIRELHARYLFPSVMNYYDESLPLVRGKGTSLWDADGREYLDFFGGILTVSLGHCDDEVTARVQEQVGTLQHCSTLYPTPQIVLFAKRLAEIAPGELSQSYFVNSGTEANETAVMLAKQVTGSQEVIVQRHAYGGRSHLAASLMGHATWRPLPSQIPGVRHAPAPYCYRCPFKLEYPSCDVACAQDLEELIDTTTTGRPAAFMAEPILGVGGFVTPPPEYFQIVSQIVRERGGLFIADEVQTWARLGQTWFGIEHWGVTPDIATMAKGLANGAPVGATITRPELAAQWGARGGGLQISTFGGNPVTSVAATATIVAIDSRGLLQNAHDMGLLLRQRLDALAEQHALIGEVRGKGLMQGVELVEDRQTKAPAKRAIAALFEETKSRGLLIGKGGLYGNVLRITPPLNVTADEIARAMDLLDASLTAVEAAAGATAS